MKEARKSALSPLDSREEQRPGSAGESEWAISVRGQRGPELIAVFAIGADGSLTLADQVYTQGDLPTDFAHRPHGRLSARRESENERHCAF